MVFWFIERPRPKLLSAKIVILSALLTFGDNLSSRNRDMSQSVILYSCDLERSRLSVRSIIFLHCNSYTTHEYICQVSLKSYFQLLRYGSLKVARRKRKKEERRRRKRNSLTDVHTLWSKLRHEGEIWCKSDQHIIWRSFPEPSFGISWGSIHWAVIEIELPKLCLKSWELL